MLQYVTSQQMKQIEAMNPRADEIAYSTALGFLKSEIGHIYDLDVMIKYQENNIERDSTLYWIMLVITCRNFLGATMAVSEVLQSQYEEAIAKINIIKSGFSTLHDAPKAPEPNARMAIVNNSKKMLG